MKGLEADWLIYFYECECYEGWGLALLKRGGKYEYGYLGHCSCYGPTDDWPDKVLTKEELVNCFGEDEGLEGRKRLDIDWDYNWWKAVEEKFKEIEK